MRKNIFICENGVRPHDAGCLAHEAATDPNLVKTAPHTTRVRRLDEVGAARNPILRWDPSRPDKTSAQKKAEVAEAKHREPAQLTPTV